MRVAPIFVAMAIVAATVGTNPLAAQTGESQRDRLPHRMLVLAHPDPASRELAAAVRRQLASDRRYEIVADRALTRTERPVDTSADSLLTQKRTLALVLKADAFIDIDASRVADGSRIMAIRSISDSRIVDVVNVTSIESATDIARTLVDRLLPNGWPGRSR